MKRMIIGGNDAAALAVKQSFVDVVSAYPITPQTSVIERIAHFISKGEMDTDFIKVESEHSAMAALIGASAAGARTFTATSSQGLLLMHEVLHWASGARLPIVMANANRAIGPPWSIWAEQTDSLSQRDTGWIQLYASSSQEVYDLLFIAFRAAELSLFPAMVCLDGFLLTHTKEPVSIFEDSEVEPYIHKKLNTNRFNFTEPQAIGALAFPRDYIKIKTKQHKDMLNSIAHIRTAMREFNENFSREYAPITIYGSENATISIVTSGTLAQTAMMAVDKLNQIGVSSNLVKLTLFRPFPAEELKECLAHSEKVIVFDRNVSHGKGGIIKDELGGATQELNLLGIVCGLGGYDVTEEDIIKTIIDIVGRKIKTDYIL